jgi:hypothetical protein
MRYRKVLWGLETATTIVEQLLLLNIEAREAPCFGLGMSSMNQAVDLRPRFIGFRRLCPTNRRMRFAGKIIF